MPALRSDAARYPASPRADDDAQQRHRRRPEPTAIGAPRRVWRRRSCRRRNAAGRRSARSWSTRFASDRKRGTPIPRSSRVGRDELMQEGVVGLLLALERYDPQRGVPFWGYAVWWVRQAMQQVVSELSGPIVLSDRALRQLARLKSAQRRFEQMHRREATSAELSAMIGLPRRKSRASCVPSGLRVGWMSRPAWKRTTDDRRRAGRRSRRIRVLRAGADTGARRAGAGPACVPDRPRANGGLLPLRTRQTRADAPRGGSASWRKRRAGTTDPARGAGKAPRGIGACAERDEVRGPTCSVGYAQA